MNIDNEKFLEALLSLDRITVQELVEEQASVKKPIEFIDGVVVPALERIGAEWLNGNLALSQVYMAGRMCEQIIDTILPPEDPDRKNQPKMAICVLNDHHVLGKTIVYSLLRSSGFELTDFGTLDVNDLIARLEKEKTEILLISVLMLPSALKIKTVRGKDN